METLIALFIGGIVIGTIVVMFGGGGAAIYLGILTAVIGLPAAAATSTSLVTALPSVIIGAITYYRQGRINFKYGNQLLIAALPTVIIGSLVAPYIPTPLYSWIVGIILILLGINMFWQLHAPQHDETTINGSNRLKAVLFGILAGLMVGVGGMSGGAAVIAGLFLLGLPSVSAAATSSYVLACMSLLGTTLHISSGNVDWSIAISLMIGAMIGAAAAPHLLTVVINSKVGKYFQPAMAGLLIILGIKTLIGAS
ncbi:sulfite exporter TauE/SafE family protein [Limosilactobacillus agrestimuris]|uniref:sulfite exporter TauE/SafE family protein n=1 Tax=Limosilactobacillus agrestimuris TaxID=2941331 RepID=UPI00203ED848|nr:sulfite exporter TauE/SafE family protein [Limosilactobacillus agrestimuris]